MSQNQAKETKRDNFTPRVYVACLAAYNAGKLHGAWIDVDDEDTLWEGIHDVLKSSPEPNVHVDDCETCGESHGSAEEWAVHDNENWHGYDVGEHPDVEGLARLGEAIAEADDDAEPLLIWLGNQGQGPEDFDDASDLVEGFREAYRGTWRTIGDYAEDLAEQCGMLEGMPENLRMYFDFERFARDMEMGGDVWTHEGGEGCYVFDACV